MADALVDAPTGNVGGTGRGLGPLRNAWFLWLCCGLFSIPTMVSLARDWWTLEQGQAGPIILASSLWLFHRARHEIAAAARPGKASLTALGLAVTLPAYIFARVTGMLGIECLAMYGALLTILYFHVGFAALKPLRFPLIYILFMFPLPETIILPLSRMLKLLLSSAAVGLLSKFGFEIGQGGVVIYIDQYELLVATACSGLHSLIGLSAIGVFYCYIHYGGNWRQSWPLLIAIPFIAIFSNFIRVLTLILVTHYWGERIASKYYHDFASIALFMFAIFLLVGADVALIKFRKWRDNGR
ncbi:exosortase V [Sphingomonas crocodyli]|uniref:Exosortase/archaeosortase family protein n=1 Tax=Sphingomonas crocodyli TaxID=1979270 RepID=A0A437LXP3_9SPHN|nr:exosortase V [Sphingomonas crocodyli]RVT90181.1 exosortase/archaeosortase family protein [Sphingomonas crocodyli]